MNDKSYAKNGDRMGDSSMDIDSSDVSISSASDVFELSFQPEVRTQLSQKNPLLMDLLSPDSNQPLSSSRRNSVERLHRNLPFLSKDELPILHDDPEPLRSLLTVNPPNEMSAATNFSKMQTSPDRSEIEEPSSTSDTQPSELPIQPGNLLRSLLTVNRPDEQSATINSVMQTSSEIHEASVSEENSNLQEVENKQEAATPKNLALVQDFFSAEAKTSTSFGGTQSCDRTCSPVEPRSEKYLVYAYEAQTLLQSVLKEIAQYHAENECWRILAPQFLDDPDESSSKKCRSDLEKDIINHIAGMDTDLPRKWAENVRCIHEMSIETYAMGAYEVLFSSVLTALTLIKTVRLSCDFEGFILTYVSLKALYETFPHYWKTNNIGDIENEASRNRLKTLKEKVQRLLLVAVTAFRLFFMYIGENAEDEKLVEYEKYLSDEDKTYLRRKNLTLKTFKN